jgi:hypothetical protein
LYNDYTMFYPTYESRQQKFVDTENKLSSTLNNTKSSIIIKPPKENYYS